MDPARTVSELALFATASVPFVLLGAGTVTRTHATAGTAALLTTVILTFQAPPHRLDIGWGAASFEPLADFMDQVSADQDLARPLVANPDLGAVSWRKHFNVLDLGRLGSGVIRDCPRRAST